MSALKQKILDKIMQSNTIKPLKINVFMIVCKFLSHKGNFYCKVPSKLFLPFTLNVKNITSLHQTSTLYLKLSNKH